MFLTYKLSGKRLATAFLLLIFLFLLLNRAQAARVKDLAFVEGGRENQLIGYSLVVGLNGSGDSAGSLASRTPLIDALERIGVVLTPQDIVGRSVAAVMVTATLPPYSKKGSKIDILVSTIGDAITLQGGTLLLTPLRGSDRNVYAVGQGIIIDIPKGIETVDGTNITGNPRITNLSPYQNYTPTVGRVSDGATIEKEIDLDLNLRTFINLSLNKPDFTTAYRIASAINSEFSNGIAKAEDAGSIAVSIPNSYLSNTVELISKIENLNVLNDKLAKVVVDERSGTVVIGDDVLINPVAISLNNINLLIREEGVFPRTSYTPKQLAYEADNRIDQNQAGGAAQAQGDQDKSILPVPVHDKNYALYYPGGVSLKEIVDGLNKIGITNRELIDIIKNLKAAGAMNADLVIR